LSVDYNIERKASTYDIVINLDVVPSTLQELPCFVQRIDRQRLAGDTQLLVSLRVAGDDFFQVLEVVFVVRVGQPDNFVQPPAVVHQIPLHMR